MMQMEGIFTPIITPHQEDGAIDKESFACVAEFLIESGVHCILVGGSTGEYYAQTFEERVEMMRLANEIIGKRVPFDDRRRGHPHRRGGDAGQGR